MRDGLTVTRKVLKTKMLCAAYHNSYPRWPVHVTPKLTEVRNSAARCKRGVEGISSRWELQILPSYQLGIVSALEATHDEMAPTDILKVIDKKRVDQRPSGSTNDGQRLCHSLL